MLSSPVFAANESSRGVLETAQSAPKEPLLRGYRPVQSCYSRITQHRESAISIQLFISANIFIRVEVAKVEGTKTKLAMTEKRVASRFD